ncbi:MAG TPA: class I SAM-dependent methyltransferase [Candidatus Limnocylindrales bacterium]
MTTYDFAGLKAVQQRTWASGDYAAVAAIIQPMADLLVMTVDPRPRARVLDVATGSGNAAIAAARRNCAVTGLDFTPELLERGRARAAAENLEVEFVEGDAEDIPFPDASFDVVLSCVGVMFAPDQPRAAAELARVCRPGGKIGLVSWTPDGFAGALFRAIGRYAPPPPGVRPAVEWGTAKRLRELLGHSVSRLDTEELTFRIPHEPGEYADLLRGKYGPVLKAFAALDAAKQQRLFDDLVEVCRKYRWRAGNGTAEPDPAVIAATYLQAVAVRA